MKIRFRRTVSAQRRFVVQLLRGGSLFGSIANRYIPPPTFYRSVTVRRFVMQVYSDSLYTAAAGKSVPAVRLRGQIPIRIEILKRRKIWEYRPETESKISIRVEIYFPKNRACSRSVGLYCLPRFREDPGRNFDRGDLTIRRVGCIPEEIRRKAAAVMKRYYIGGKQYVPEKSIRLCHYTGIFERVTLYRTEKGAFFLVTDRECDGLSVRVISREDAFAFMDTHAADIDTDSYDALFGEPEEG